MKTCPQLRPRQLLCASIVRDGLAVVPMLLAVACGSRSGIDINQNPDAVAATVDVSVMESAVSIDDGTDTGVDAPAGPCHLVLSGEPVTTIAFPEQPNWSFHNEGLVVRTMADGTPHVVQFGAVGGAGDDGWGDPALYAAEYDVSVWPPRVVQPPTAISLGDQGQSFAVVLADNRLLFGWILEIDYAGLGPWSILYRTADGTPWQLGDQGRLADNSVDHTAPAIAADDNSFSMAYMYQDVGDASTSVGLPTLLANDGLFSSFTRDGIPTGASSQFWRVDSAQSPWSEAGSALARTRTTDLIAVYFPSCGPGIVSDFCQPGSFVILRATPSGALESAAALQPENAGDIIEGPQLASDANGDNWLMWVESAQVDGGVVAPAYLFAVPLTDDGALAGPVEAWLSTDSYPGVTTGVSVGSVGVIDPLWTYETTDGGVDLRQVHIVHRPLGVEQPVEDISFTTASTSYPAGAVQIAEPRSVIAGYSTYPADAAYAAQGYGLLARYTCIEDQH